MAGLAIVGQSGLAITGQLIAAGLSTPAAAPAKKKKFVPIGDVLPDALGFNSVAITKAPRPNGDSSRAFIGTRSERNLSEAELKRYATDAYWAMEEPYKTSFPLDKDCANMPAAMAALGVPSLGKVYFASSVREGPTPQNVHPTLFQHGPHRLGFKCAEMQAVNNVLVANGALPAGLTVKVFGTPDGEDRGVKGGKAIMQPCKTDGGSGCEEVLRALGIAV